MPMESEARQDLAGEVDAPSLTRLLSAEIIDANPDAFGENVEILLAMAKEPQAEARLGPVELKVLVRRLGQRFEERSGNQVFSRGVYQTFFSAVRAPDGASRSLLDTKLGLLGQVSSLLENPALTVQSLRPILLRFWGELCRGLPAEEPDQPDARFLPWLLFEALVRGVLQMETFSTAERAFHYAVLAPSARYEICRQDERRQVLLGDLRFSLGDAFPRRPSLTRLLWSATALAPMDRALLVQAVRSRRSCEVEPFAQLLRHHVFLLALTEADLRSPYFALVDALLMHLLGGVLAEARDEMGMVMRVYLTLLRERHIPALRRWCDRVRESRDGAEIFADLLYEPYLLRLGLLRGGREPGIRSLIQDWTVLQEVMERQGGYQGEPFSLPDRLRVLERDWLRSRRASQDVSWDMGSSDGDPLAAQIIGRRARGRTLSEYDTFVRLPVMPGLLASLDLPPTLGRTGSIPLPQEPLSHEQPPAPEAQTPEAQTPASDPFSEDATTERFGLHDESDLFDALTQRLPSLGVNILVDEQSGALFIPSEEGRRGALYRASTVILPSSAPGMVEEGLHQAATLIFPVQSVPVTRNEAICRRLDVILTAGQSIGQRSSERLRLELVGMPDEDRIIAEQYLGQVIERKMARISGRVTAAHDMSMVTLDNYAGTLLSGVLRDLVVTGYLRRVFLAECAGLQSQVLQGDLADLQVGESLQLALFTVLNAHQERLTLPVEMERGLRDLASWPPSEPIPCRLPYHIPERVSVPPRLWDRFPDAICPQVLSEAKQMLTDDLGELDRVVDRVNSLELFLDIEAVLGEQGLTSEAFLGLATELQDRVRLVIERARGLFVGLDDVGAESAVLERVLLDLIGYGRAVWSRSAFPALGFYAKMAFGVREDGLGL